MTTGADRLTRWRPRAVAESSSVASASELERAAREGLPLPSGSIGALERFDGSESLLVGLCCDEQLRAGEA